MKLVEKAKSVVNFYFWIDFWKLLNQTFSIFYMSKFQIFFEKFIFYIIPGVSRTFDRVL